MFDSIFFNGDEYNQMWLNGNKIWEKDNGVVDEYPEYDTVVVYYVGTGSVSGMFSNDKVPKIDTSLSASKTHLWTDGKYQCWGLNNYYPSGQENSYSNTCYPVQIRKVSLPKGKEYADGSLTLTGFMNKYCRDTTSVSSELYPPYIDWTFFDFRKVKEMNLLSSDVSYATTVGNVNVWDTSCSTTMEYLFRDFWKVTSLDLSNWNTSQVTNMQEMFKGCNSLTSLDVSNFDTSKVTNMNNMFYGCESLKKLDLSSFDTSAVTSYSYMFSGVSNCTIYIGDGWTLGTSSTLGRGTNNTFIKYVPIESIGELNCNADTSNVTDLSFTITPTITPSDYAAMDLIVEYDSNYLATSDNFTFTLVSGCQGRSLDITYRSRKNPSVSKSITITVSEDWKEPLLIDFTQETAPTYPSWFTEETKDSSCYFTHEKLCYNGSYYGLTHCTYFNAIYWTCYKLVAPTTGTLQFTYWAKCYSSSRPFTIHITTSATQPTYSSSTNRILNATDSTYATTDAIATMEVTQGETYYVHLQYRGNNQNSYGACIRSIELLQPIGSIDLSYDVDLSNIEQQVFTVSPIIEPTNYDVKDLEIIYDSNYMTINPTTFEITLKDGSQGMSHTITYRSKADNSISKSITFYVSENLEIVDVLIDFTQSTAPTLPDYMTVDGTSTYKFSHGLYTTDVYGLIPNNKGRDSSTAYTRYKYVAPASGDLTFTYRCSAETNYDYLTVHVTTTTSQPSTTNATNQVFTTKGVSTYADTDGTASVLVVEGTTYYIHIQYTKDSSSSSGYDMGCIRTIELI